jgi:hypothetical protein
MKRLPRKDGTALGQRRATKFLLKLKTRDFRIIAGECMTIEFCCQLRFEVIQVPSM